MRWQDVDLDRAEWCYTVSKTKTDHLVPLSKQAVAILRDLYKLTGNQAGGWVFPGGRSPLRPMSDGAINSAYRGLGIDTQNDITAHGWRSVARTMLKERLKYDEEFIERQLAHAVKNVNGSAYDRAQYLDDRRPMMQVWSDYLDKLKKGAEVIDLKAA
jgi:integrase